MVYVIHPKLILWASKNNKNIYLKVNLFDHANFQYINYVEYERLMALLRFITTTYKLKYHHNQPEIPCFDWIDQHNTFINIVF